MAKTLDAVQRRIAKPTFGVVPPPLQCEEELIIPRLTIGIDRSYSEIIGALIQNPRWSGRYVADATQIIKFQLDESGAILESQSEVIADSGPGPAPVPPKPRRFVFDKPFLIYLQERQAMQPYFVMWVENAEVLVPE